MKLGGISLVGRALAALVCVSATQAFAAESSTLVGRLPSRSTFSVDDVYSDYSFKYHGPTLDKPGPYSVNRFGKLDKNAFSGFDSEATIAYHYNKSKEEGIGLDILFSNQPNIPGRAFTMGDVGIKWFRHELVMTDGLMVAVDATLHAPVSEASQEAHMRWGFDSQPFVMYNIPGTRWRTGVWGEFTYHDGVDRGWTTIIYGAPYVAYRLTDKFWLNLQYETSAMQDVGVGALTFHRRMSDIQPGFFYKPTPKIKINPYVQIFPDNPNPLAADQMALGMVFFARVL